MATQVPRGMQGSAPKPITYQSYKSPYGPSYKLVRNFHGIGMSQALKIGATLGSFGVVAGFFAAYFFADVPRVRKDIWQRVPILGSYFIREVPPEDNPF